MKMFLEEVLESQFKTPSGEQKYSVIDGDGKRHTSTDARLFPLVGTEVDVLEETGVFKGKEWSKIQLNDFNGRKVIEDSPSTPQATLPESTSEKPDWDAISEGKVRHGVAVAFIGKTIDKVELTDELKEEMQKWVDWIIGRKDES